MPHPTWYMQIFSLNLCLEVMHMPYLYQTKLYVLNLCFLGWGTCLTLLYLSEFFLKLVLRGEAYASPLSNKILYFEFIFLGWGTCLTFLDISEIFSLSLWLEMRHMPHLCKTKFHFVEFMFCILWIFLSEKIVFCCDCV